MKNSVMVWRLVTEVTWQEGQPTLPVDALVQLEFFDSETEAIRDLCKKEVFDDNEVYAIWFTSRGFITGPHRLFGHLVLDPVTGLASFSKIYFANLKWAEASLAKQFSKREGA